MSKEENSKEKEKIKEEEIIEEEIMNNYMLQKEIEDLEEEEDEDSFSEKDKITEEILDNKLSFIIPEENDEKQNIKNSKKKTPTIHRDIIENSLKELFKYHYGSISEENKENLEKKLFQVKTDIEFFCSKLNSNFSKYILLSLDQKIYELIEYVEKIIKTDIKTVNDILKIKNSLIQTGKEFSKILEKPFQKTSSFDISSILNVLFIGDILSDNKINISDQEYEQIIEVESYEEKDRFEKYIEECKAYFDKIETGENGDNDEDIEVYYEEENLNEKEEEKEENNEKEEENSKENKNENINITTKDEKKKDILILEDIIKKDNIDNNSKQTNNNDNNSSINDKKEGNNNTGKNENKIDNNFSNIEDLVNYINGSDNKKKKKRKKKKKQKVQKVNNIEERKDNDIENNINEIDDVFENFKLNLINFTDKMRNVKKIKPIISEEFLEKIKLIN